LLATAFLAGGCAGPGVLRELPDPVFGTPQRVSPPAVAQQPPPPPAPAPPPRRTVLAGTTIIVDAGHGGHDPGAQGVSRLPEKAITLAITTRLVRLLESAGARVVTTRSRDVFIELDDRAAMADRVRTDLFVSIHADSAARAAASGATVYIARNASGTSERAGEAVAAALRRAGIECRGIHRAGFRVLVGHSRPAMLVECGFLTNSRDAALLNTAAYQDRLAAAIADGIAAHFSR